LELPRLTRRVGDLVALDGRSFTVAEGQTFGFMGPSGASKTTAMWIILGVLAPDAGQVRWFRHHDGRECPNAPDTWPRTTAKRFSDSSLVDRSEPSESVSGWGDRFRKSADCS
jgi:ABC-type multidrug transport system ATPase subunit